MKHFFYHLTMCFATCGAFHLVDAKFNLTGRVIAELVKLGVW